MLALWNFLSCITIDDTFMGLFWQDIGAQRWQGGHADGYSYGQYVVSTRKPDGYSHICLQKRCCMYIHMNCSTGFDKNLTKRLMFYVQCLDISSSPINARKKFYVLKNSQSSFSGGCCVNIGCILEHSQVRIMFKSTFFQGVVVLTLDVYWNTVKYVLC